MLTPKDLTTTPVKMDLKATGKTARVRLCWRANPKTLLKRITANRRSANRIETLPVNYKFLFCFVTIAFVYLFLYLFGKLIDKF